MFVRKVVGSSRGRRDFGVQIWEDHLHLKDHLHRLRTGLGPTTFLLVEAGVCKKKKIVWFILWDLNTLNCLLAR